MDTTSEQPAMRDLLATDYGWTPRQREVLSLVARGKTNAEIGEALGISLDGAKWHMREILSKLGVDAREEAAEYWRRYNGLAPRFGRVFRGMAGGGAAKWAGGATIATAAIGAAVVVVIVLNQPGDETESVPGTPAATTSPTAGASATTTATPPAGHRTLNVNGRVVPVADATMLAPTDNPGSLSLLVTHGCWACDVPDMEIDRLTWDGKGAVEREVVFSAEERVGSYITGIGASDDGSILVAGVCIRSYCGPMGSEFYNDARVRIYRSLDGGASWDELATVDGYAFPRGVARDGQAIVQRFESNGESYVARLPSGERYAVPEQVAGRPDWPWVVGGQPWWKPTAAGRMLWSAEREWTLDLPDDASVTGVTSWGRGGEIWSWQAPAGSSTTTFVGDPGEDRFLRIGWLVPLPDLHISTWVRGSTSLAGNASMGGRRVPVLLHQGPDPNDLRIEPLSGPMFPAEDRNRVIAASLGPFVKVAGAGDCLNVRESPSTSAKSLGCYRDGVLLQDSGETTQAEARTWVKVLTPAPIGEWVGQAGWASMEFLER